MINRLKIFVNQKSYFSVGLVFAILSILFSFWITRLPLLKQKLEINDGELGLALFFIPMGAVVAMLLTNQLISKIGEGRVTIFSTLGLSLACIFPFVITDIYQFGVVLFIIGIMLGFVDVSMNAIAGYFEEKDNVNIMSTCHGFFSLGGMLGAGIGSLLIGMTINPLIQMVVSAVVVILLLIFYLSPTLFKVRSEHQGDSEHIFAIPRGPLIGLAIISFCCFLSEGAVTDWSTVYLQDFLMADPYLVGFGFAGFSMMMTLGRFNGDYLISKFGEKKIMYLGAFLAAIGNIFVLFSDTIMAIVGFSIMGIGFSTLVPIAFSAASKTKEFSSSYGIAAVASMGYAGFLLGPVIMGLVAESYDLNVSFLLILLLSGITILGIAISSKHFSDQ